jgi:hypothetical protein
MRCERFTCGLVLRDWYLRSKHTFRRMYDILYPAWCHAMLWPCTNATRSGSMSYGDEKVANREIRVWHGATENGP